MAFYDGSRLVLQGAELEAFLGKMRRPDPEVMRRRDEYFARLDQMQVDMNPDGSVEVELAPKRQANTEYQESEKLVVRNGTLHSTECASSPSYPPRWFSNDFSLSAA